MGRRPCGGTPVAVAMERMTRLPGQSSLYCPGKMADRDGSGEADHWFADRDGPRPYGLLGEVAQHVHELDGGGAGDPVACGMPTAAVVLGRKLGRGLNVVDTKTVAGARRTVVCGRAASELVAPGAARMRGMCLGEARGRHRDHVVRADGAEEFARSTAKRRCHGPAARWMARILTGSGNEPPGPAARTTPTPCAGTGGPVRSTRSGAGIGAVSARCRSSMRAPHSVSRLSDALPPPAPARAAHTARWVTARSCGGDEQHIATGAGALPRSRVGSPGPRHLDALSSPPSADGDSGNGTGRP